MSTEAKLTRIAIVDENKCKPKKCNQECRKSCPVVKMGKLCIEVASTSKFASIAESLCVGCGICSKQCKFGAIQIINVPTNLEAETSHRYGPNSFKLHRLPVLGLVGKNGIGKSTALLILTGKIKPNLGKFNDPPEWKEIINHYKGSELQSYLTKLSNGELKVVHKPQYVDAIPKSVKGKVLTLLQKYSDDEKAVAEIVEDFDLKHLLQRDLEQLSGGELQRFALAITCMREADIYVFDEPSSYLDVYQRMKMANRIRKLKALNKYIIVVEHDLSVLDYMSDLVCCLYGKAGAYGVITFPFTVKEGINVYLSGFIPTENMRFRQDTIDFHLKDVGDEIIERRVVLQYPLLRKTLGTFSFECKPGSFSNSEITVIVGMNGLGKTVFMRMLAGAKDAQPTESSGQEVPVMNISYKPQKISPTFDGTVLQLFQTKIPSAYHEALFQSAVVVPLGVRDLLDQEVKQLSGGQLQVGYIIE
jgi:ATP-binding cassette subfamily E protein 1